MFGKVVPRITKMPICCKQAKPPMPNTGVDKAKDICRHQHCVQMFGSRVHSLLNSSEVRVDVLRQTKEEKRTQNVIPAVQQ